MKFPIGIIDILYEKIELYGATKSIFSFDGVFFSSKEATDKDFFVYVW